MAGKPRRSSSSREAVATPDGRYLLIGGRLWRATNPDLADPLRHRLVADLMTARRAVKNAMRGKGDLRAARDAVDRAKQGLGERGAVWWADGAPDLNRRLVANTTYADWAKSLAAPVTGPQPSACPERS